MIMARSEVLPGEPITLVLVIDNIVSYVVGGRIVEQPVANAAGAFSVSFDSIRVDGGERGVLRRAPGYRTILAVGEDGSRASSPVMVTSLNAPVTSVLSSLTATAEIWLYHEYNVLETKITATGAGFIPGEAVTVTLFDATPGTDKILVGVTADYSGAFIAQVTLYGPTPAEGADYEMPITPGVYTLLADGDSGSLATVCSPNPPLDAHRSTSPTMPSVVTSQYTAYHSPAKERTWATWAAAASSLRA